MGINIKIMITNYINMNKAILNFQILSSRIKNIIKNKLSKSKVFSTTLLQPKSPNCFFNLKFQVSSNSNFLVKFI